MTESQSASPFQSPKFGTRRPDSALKAVDLPIRWGRGCRPLGPSTAWAGGTSGSRSWNTDGYVRLEFLRQLLDDQRIVRALVDANPTANAQAFGNVRFARFGVHHDAFLSVADRRAKRVALVVALLRLTVVNLEHATRMSNPPNGTRRWRAMNVTSDEALQVLGAAHELGRAGRRGTSCWPCGARTWP